MSSGGEEKSNSVPVVPVDRQIQEGSDLARVLTQSRRRISNIAEHPSPIEQTTEIDVAESPQDFTADDSFSDERCVSAASWDETRSFDSEEHRGRQFGTGNHPGGRSNDGRKHFDTTTPTLIDEEDEEDSEMLQLQRSYDIGKDGDIEMRRTPGASMLKSADETSLDDGPVRSGPSGAEAAGRPGSRAATEGDSEPPALPVQIPVATSRIVSDSADAPLGNSTRIGVRVLPSGSGERSLEQEQQSAWGPYPPSSKQSSELPGPTRFMQQQQAEAGGLFSFEPWTRPKSPGANAVSGGRINSGAFSPNILRLTEDIGNLLQEDEDDDYALEIPNVFRGVGDTNTTNIQNTEFDWTGSYMFDADRRRKPAVPSRSAVGPEKSSRRRGSNLQQQQQTTSTTGSTSFIPNAQQPKPRRNEVFEFGKSIRTTTSEERESPQLLNFGGAFAPPGINTGGFMRPVASFQPAEPTTTTSGYQHGAVSPFISSSGFRDMSSPRTVPLPGYQHGQSGSFQLGVASVGQQSFSYNVTQSGHGAYMPQDIYRSTSPAYGITVPPSAYAAQQSDMQATARVFVPHFTRAPTPTGLNQGHTQWPQQQRQSPLEQQNEMSLELGSWHSVSGSNYNSSYGVQVQPSLGSNDPRGMTPSPQLTTWSQPMDGLGRGTPHQYNRPDSAMSNAYLTSPSPHPSIAGSEHSNTTAQRGGKKETRRKQRGKKKSQQRIEVPGGTSKKIAVVPKKKSEASRASPTLSVEGNDDPHASASEDLIDAKRSELVESPATRIAFKEFYRAFRGEERFSFQRAEEFALGALEDETFPEAVHWRVFLELADLAKRSNRYAEARLLYQKVCQLQPYASQGWLEYSKLEEECGHMNRVMNVLHQGLLYCEYSENLLTRAVKHQEKMGNLENARGLLARLKHVGVEKVWRTVLEGALLEARVGNSSTARRVLKYLMHHVPWYGPLYLEAYRLEKDQGHSLDALRIVERGLQAIPRYGPLWFGAFRLCEEMDLAQKQYHLPSTMNMVERAAVNISKELVWKVHLDASQMLERSALEQASIDDPGFDALLAPARCRLAMTILTSPNNLRWKVWLAAARMELGFGNIERARALFLRAHEVVPKKGRSSTLMECARLEDFVGDTNLARAILFKGRLLHGHDWKVWLESVLLEIRGGHYLKAMEICDNALEIHQGTGRLWATLVQLRQYYGRDEAQQIALQRALNAVPKSGEVWCEGGRIHLNPFSSTFDLDRARRHLYFATRFTPQYGDGFVETIRLEIIKQWLAPIASLVWEQTKHAFRVGPGRTSEDGLTKYVTDVSLAISVASRITSEQGGSLAKFPKLLHQNVVGMVRKMLDPEAQVSLVDLNDVRLACVNADPNYGLLWFYCRRKATDTPRQIIEDTAGIIAEELRTYAHLYLAAMIRREAIMSTIDLEKPSTLCEDTIETSDPAVVMWEDHVDAKLHAAPSLEEMFNPTDPTTGILLLENTANGTLFATGLTTLNNHQSLGEMSLADRRRALFGNDALFP